MRILLTVEHYMPSVGGSQEVVKQIAERLVLRGHDVTVATTHLPERADTDINGVHIAPFPIAGNVVLGITGPAEQRTFDILQLQGAGANPVEFGLEQGTGALRITNRGAAQLNAQVRLAVDAANLHTATSPVGLNIEATQAGVLRPGNWRNIQGQSLQLDRLNLAGARLRTDQIRP